MGAFPPAKHDGLAHDRDPERPTVSIALLVAINVVPAIAINIMLPSMPRLVSYFQTDIPTVYHALSLYLFGLATGQLAYGPLSDRLGRRPVLLAGVAVYCVGSLICALAPSIAVFLSGRILQAIGGCAGIVLSRAMVRDVHAQSRVASVYGYMVMVISVAAAIAPPIGGALDALFGWRAPFIFLTGAGLAVLAACALWAKETAKPSGTPPGPLWSGYRAILQQGDFWRFALYSSLLMASFYTFVAGAPIVMIELWGHAPTEFGIWWTFGSAAYIAGSYLAGRFSEELGPERMLRISSPIVLVGAAVLLAMLCVGPRHPLALFVPAGIVFVGSALAQPTAISRAINVDAKNAGSASGLLGFMQILFGFLAISLLGLFPAHEPVYFGAICSGTLVIGVAISMYLKTSAS